MPPKPPCKVFSTADHTGRPGSGPAFNILNTKNETETRTPKHEARNPERDTRRQVTCVMTALLNYYNSFEVGNFSHPGKATVIPEATFVPVPSTLNPKD